MAEYFGDIKDQEELKFKLSQQKRLEKQTINKIKKYLKTEHIKPLEWQNIPQIENKTTNIVIKNSNPEEEPKDGRPEFESRCERYEWHLNNGFANDNDVVWFKEYEQTDEYKQIYGGRTNAS